jgi:hypothetical protein
MQAIRKASARAFLDTSDVVTPSGNVEFRLADGTGVTVRDNDLRRIYEALWDLSALPGAVSTAALLLHESGHPARLRHPVDLNVAQGDVLRQALARFADD